MNCKKNKCSLDFAQSGGKDPEITVYHDPHVGTENNDTNTTCTVDLQFKLDLNITLEYCLYLY